MASKIRFLALAASVALVAACTYGRGSTPESRAAQAEANAAQAREQSIQSAMGNMSQQSYEPGLGTGGILDLFGPGRGEPARQIGVNKYLWTASLDVLSFLPLEGADPFSGVIVTDWGRIAGDPTPFRVTVLISEPALDARSLRVAAFRQVGGRSAPVSAADNRRLEDAILTRARQLRIASAERR